MFTKTVKHPDIILLETRIKQLVRYEEYERAAIIKRWIDELTIYYQDRIFIENEYQENYKGRTT